jgi:Mrp family chromosome partitioning ATPase
VLDLQLGQIDAQIETLESVIGEARAELTRLEDAIARTPLNAITLGPAARLREHPRAIRQRRREPRPGLDRRADRTDQPRSAHHPDRGRQCAAEPARPNRRLIAAASVALGIGLTSATPNCGKSFVAANLALGCARNADLRVIMLEFDLREPDIARMLDLPRTADLAPVLEGRAQFGQQAVRYRDNVAISAAHTGIADPTSVLLSRKTAELVERIQTDYAPDLMIFDVPPVLTSDDSRAILKDMDCAIMVAKAGASTLPQVDNCEREIAEQTNVLGIVLNDCRDGTDLHG